MRLDFERYSFAVPDLLYMLSSAFWPFLMILLILLTVFTFVTRNFSLIPIVSAFLFIAFPLIQWPTIFGWDQFLHTTIARSLIDPKGMDSWYTIYGTEYPGSFSLLNSVTIVTGLNYIVSAILLSVIVKVLTLTLVYVISKDILGNKLAQISLALFILANFRLADYFQFSPQALAFPFFFLVISVCLKPMSRSRFAAITLLMFAVTVTHPFTSVLMITTFLGIYIVQLFRHKEQHYISILSFVMGIAIWLSWQLYAATGISEQELTGLWSFLAKDFSVNYLIHAILTFGRGVSNVILLRYKQMLLAFIAIGTLIGLVSGFKERKVRFLTGILLGAILFSVVLTVLSEPPYRIWLDRALLMGLLAPIVLTIYGFQAFSVSRKRIAKTLPYMCIMLIAFSFLANLQYTYMFSVKQWEMDASKFLFASPGPNLDVSSDGITILLVRNLNIDLQANRTLSGYGLSRFATDPSQLHSAKGFLTSRLILRSFRQKVDWYYVQGTAPTDWDVLDRDLLLSNPYRHKIYDNSLAQIYSSASKDRD
jgi:hypothetical protein